jgi:hypothetical protein
VYWNLLFVYNIPFQLIFLHQAEVEVQEDAVAPGEKVLLIDDLLATGGEAFHCSWDVFCTNKWTVWQIKMYIDLTKGTVFNWHYLSLFDKCLHITQ